jgi:hypothetical protein
MKLQRLINFSPDIAQQLLGQEGSNLNLKGSIYDEK